MTDVEKYRQYHGMYAIILSVGDELVSGQTIDTNAAWLSSRLAEYGVLTRYHQTIPDDHHALVQAVRQAAERAGWVILTGGLGPTPDDLTRQVLAEVLQTRLVLHVPSLKRIERFFQDRGRNLTKNNRIQAFYPDGSEILENPCGTATGLKLNIGKATIFALPGVPEEMSAMFARTVIPMLAERAEPAARTGISILMLTLNTFGFGESAVAEKLGELMDRGRNPTIGTTASHGIVSVRIRSVFKTVEKARTALNQTAVEIRARLGTAVFSEGDETLQAKVGRMLIERHSTVATAESCTAGLLGKMLTDKPGASAWYQGGWIVYANSLKHEQLGVPLDMLKQEGAVSEPVARSMADQALRRTQADYALALTGIAGPSGARPHAAVGTVWIALAERQPDGIVTHSKRFVFPGDRDMVRDRAAKTALNMLRMELINIAFNRKSTKQE